MLRENAIFVHGTVLHGDKLILLLLNSDLKSGNKSTFLLYIMTLHTTTKYMLIIKCVRYDFHGRYMTNSDIVYVFLIDFHMFHDGEEMHKIYP